MSAVVSGRFSAEVSDDIVVLLIGARINRPWRLRSLWLVASAMPRMLRRLAAEPELGLLHVESFRRGRTTMAVQYWASHEQLTRFATDPDLPHAPAWKAYMARLASTPDVGVFHETYVVPAGNAESIYAHMPVFGLAAATRHAPADAVGHNARARLDGARERASQRAA